ncbi:MAG: ATP-binding protein, partial [Candidatus Omnitrophica bacterium]|nr:ATP-binding protein [Candidatus Omnitrophota bacterium]
IKTYKNIDAVNILISDTGHGIKPENLKNLFMPFFSTKKDGTGLGLSICYNIIKNHNGTIEVDSQLDRGTAFLIKLPCIKKGGKNGG